MAVSKLDHNKTRKGAASLYIVVFTTLLLGVTTTSFIRIMLDGANQSAVMNASQAAYDAALIGIEDAKIALAQYHKCLSDGATLTSPDPCGKIIRAMTDPIAPTNCNILGAMGIRSYNVDGEVVVGGLKVTDSAGVDIAVADAGDQAYGCVTITEESEDYIGQLNKTNQVRLVPVRVGQNTSGDSAIRDIQAIKVSWFSPANIGLTGAPDLKDISGDTQNKSPSPTAPTNRNSNNNMLTDNAKTSAPAGPSALSVQLIQVASEFSLEDLSLNAGSFTDVGSVLLVPSSSAVPTLPNTLPESYASHVGLAISNDKSPNQPVPIDCRALSGDYYCHATINIPEPIGTTRNEGGMFVRLAIPYGDPDTDFSVSLCSAPNCAAGADPIRFTTQPRIQAQGRAGTAVRRIEARVELNDLYYPLVQYALSNTAATEKNFWVTTHNWGGPNTGDASTSLTMDDGGPSGTGKTCSPAEWFWNGFSCP